MSAPNRSATAAASPSTAKVTRDHRIDAVRGLALMMIFVDHIPDDRLNLVTMHNFGFCDAAEVFVLLAGLAATLAYGPAIDRDGLANGSRRVGGRCLRIYLMHITLVLSSMVIVGMWVSVHHTYQSTLQPLLSAGMPGVARVLALQALPPFLDILPLYVVLLSVFPLIYLGLRRNVGWTLAVSGMVWLVGNAASGLNLPNWMDGKGWYFNPFTWQFLFTIGGALAMALRAGEVRAQRGLVAVCWVFLGFALLQGGAWQDWHLPDLRLFPMAPPDKSSLSPLRILNILAVIYLVLTSARALRLMRTGPARLLAVCGRHSLEVFAAGCVLALVARLLFDQLGAALWLEVGVNIAGLGSMAGVAILLEHHRQPGRTARPPHAAANATYPSMSVGVR